MKEELRAADAGIFDVRCSMSNGRAKKALPRRNSPHFEFDWQQMIDHVSAAIGIAMRWLRSAERIGSAGDESLFPRLRRCLPGELPQSPRVRVRFAKQFCILPRCATVHAQLDLRDFCIARPSGSANADVRVRRHRLAFRRTRDLCFDLHFAKRGQFRNFPSPLPIRVINRLIISVKRTVDDDDALGWRCADQSGQLLE